MCGRWFCFLPLTKQGKCTFWCQSWLKPQGLNSSLSYFSTSLLTPVRWLLGPGAVCKTGTCHFGVGRMEPAPCTVLDCIWLLWNSSGQEIGGGKYMYYGIVCDTNRIAYVLKLRQKNSLQLLLVVTIFGNEIFVRCLDAFQKEVSMNIGSKCELAWVWSCNPFKCTFPDCFSNLNLLSETVMATAVFRDSHTHFL